MTPQKIKEVVISKEVKQSTSLNFREQQSWALQSYKMTHDKNEDLLK